MTTQAIGGEGQVRGRGLRRLIMIAVVALTTLTAISGPDGQNGDEEDAGGGFTVPEDGRAAITVPVRPADPLPAAADSRPAAGGALASSVTPPPPPPPPECLQTSPGGPVWRLFFSDHFEGPEVDTASWNQYHSPGHDGWGLRRPRAITIEDGLLVITAQMEDGVLVSGGMAHVRDQIYGRWVFRVRSEPDPSGATSAVVLTWPGSNNWPIDGENDMYETGRNPIRSPFKTFVHYGADNRQVELVHDADGTEWHEVAMEWTAERITMFLDGELAGEVTNVEAIPDVPHHMTIQLDAWTETMGDPVRMFVDWVEVYSLDTTSTSC